MIYYNPLNNDVLTHWIKYNPQSCFIMTQLGGDIPPELAEIIETTKTILIKRNYKPFDANSEVTGKDFLNKIWKQLLSAPLGIAIVTKNIKASTLPNIFYEIGIMNALGKETIVIKCKEYKIPSDFIRTEYIEYDKNFTEKLNNYLDRVLEIADYYEKMSHNLKAKPLLALDYLRRSYHITGNRRIKNKAKKIIEKYTFDDHSNIMLKSAFKIK